MNKKEKVVIATAPKNGMINLFKTSYHYYRNWVKDILLEGKVNRFKFLKDKIGWTGMILIDKIEADKAKKVLNDYKIKNPDTVELWW